MVEIPIIRIEQAETGHGEAEVGEPLPIPKRMRAGDAAADLAAAADVTLAAGGRGIVPTGFAVALPPEWCALILPRSGLALKHGITLLNAPGLIDSGYRGELKAIMLNTSDEDYKILRGERIAQFMIMTAPAFSFVESQELPDGVDNRGVQGFGSSGV